MTATITYRDGVAIGTIIAYVPVLFIGLLLCIRHGFGRSSGWFFLVTFALVRLVGSAFQLRTIADPTNTSLYIGIAILQNIGLAPLELISFGLISRVVSNINKSTHTAIQPSHIRLAQLLVTVALILGIIGGVDSSSLLTKTGVYVVQSKSQAALGLLIAAYVLIVLFTIFVSFHISHADAGEKRVLLAVTLGLPFMLVRLIYSSMYTFGGHKKFSSLSGSVTLYLVLGLIMELIAVVIHEVIGVTLNNVKKIPVGVPFEQLEGGESSRLKVRQESARFSNEGTQESAGSKVMNFLDQRTIIGRIAMRAAGGRQQRPVDIEMQGGNRR